MIRNIPGFYWDADKKRYFCQRPSGAQPSPSLSMQLPLSSCSHCSTPRFTRHTQLWHRQVYSKQHISSSHLLCNIKHAPSPLFKAMREKQKLVSVKDQKLLVTPICLDSSLACFDLSPFLDSHLMSPHLLAACDDQLSIAFSSTDSSFVLSFPLSAPHLASSLSILHVPTSISLISSSLTLIASESLRLSLSNNERIIHSRRTQSQVLASSPLFPSSALLGCRNGDISLYDSRSHSSLTAMMQLHSVIGQLHILPCQMLYVAACKNERLIVGDLRFGNGNPVMEMCNLGFPLAEQHNGKAVCAIGPASGEIVAVRARGKGILIFDTVLGGVKRWKCLQDGESVAMMDCCEDCLWIS